MALQTLDFSLMGSTLFPISFMNDTLSPSLSPGHDVDTFEAWYCNIQYLINISALGSFFCVFIFISVKLHSNYRYMLGLAVLVSKVFVEWHAMCREFAHHFRADATQFLLINGGSYGLLLYMVVSAILVMLPLNLYAGNAILGDQFSKTTINHIKKDSALLWVHFVFLVVVVVLVHFDISVIDRRLRITGIRDGNRNLSDPIANSTATFTIKGEENTEGAEADKIEMEGENGGCERKGEGDGEELHRHFHPLEST